MSKSPRWDVNGRRGGSSSCGEAPEQLARRGSIAAAAVLAVTAARPDARAGAEAWAR